MYKETINNMIYEDIKELNIHKPFNTILKYINNLSNQFNYVDNKCELWNKDFVNSYKILERLLSKKKNDYINDFSISLKIRICSIILSEYINRIINV